MLLTPPPVTNCPTFSNPLPLERDVLYGRPLTLLALFDVSPAFDTVDQQILIKRLSVSFGLSGLPLDWLGAKVAWYMEHAGPHGPSHHLVFLKVLSWLPYYIYFTLLTLVLSYPLMEY